MAISTISISSESISHDGIRFEHVDGLVNLKPNTTVTLNAKSIQHGTTQARDTHIFLEYGDHALLTFDTDIKQQNDKVWAKAQLRCQLPQNIAQDTWNCSDGKFSAPRANLFFSLDITPQPKGFAANVNLKDASFSDESGLHAAEKLKGYLTLVARQENDALIFNSALNWQSGEVFWQPLYLSSGAKGAESSHELQANGQLQGDVLTLNHATLKLDKVGDLSFNGEIDIKKYQLYKLDADLPNLDLAAAYPLLFKPFLGKTLLNNAELNGKAALSIRVIDSTLKTFKLQLKEANIDDKNHKFAFYDVNADIPWNYDDATNISFSYSGGKLLNMPLGLTKIGAQVNRYSLITPNITLPILDGALKLSDISAARINENWYWHLRAALTPVSMPDVSRAFKLPIMQGKVSAEIPLVTYSGEILTTDGEIALNVFDGQIKVTQLTLINALGEAPKLSADLAMRNLDLGSLTRTFSFGAIEGKLDGDVANLEMVNWKPVNMDAKVQSSPGKYAKKISQRAVENISSLGGAGAAAAIQRSFLRFFEQFNYAKMGLSCKLRNDICEMSGVESTPGGYVIVKGSGIPAITVMGYNQTVSWGELLNRIKRVIDGNTKAIVK